MLPFFLGFTKADIARSLLFTVSNDIGQIACLHAMLHKLKRVSELQIMNQTYLPFMAETIN